MSQFVAYHKMTARNDKVIRTLLIKKTASQHHTTTTNALETSKNSHKKK